jgi:fumarate reductase subunit C
VSPDAARPATGAAAAPPVYTPYHPRWYRRRVSVWWWLKNPSYATFVLRELTSVFVAGFALVTLLQVRALSAGPEAYARFERRLESPLVLAFHAVALAFVLFHSITWFNLAPKAMVVRLRGRRLPDAAVVAGNYAAWVAATAFVVAVLVVAL